MVRMSLLRGPRSWPFSMRESVVDAHEHTSTHVKKVFDFLKMMSLYDSEGDLKRVERERDSRIGVQLG